MKKPKVDHNTSAFRTGYGESAVLFAKDSGYNTHGKYIEVPPIGWVVPVRNSSVTAIGIIYYPDSGFCCVSAHYLDIQLEGLRGRKFFSRFREDSNLDFSKGSAT